MPDLLFKRRAENVVNVRSGGVQQRFETLYALLVARGVFRGVRAAEAEELAGDHDIDVFGEAVDQLPALGQGRAALERQVRARHGQAKQGAERPAHPEVLLHAAGAEPEAAAGLFIDDALAVERLRQELVHHFTDGVATWRMTLPTQVGA